MLRLVFVHKDTPIWPDLALSARAYIDTGHVNTVVLVLDHGLRRSATSGPGPLRGLLVLGVLRSSDCAKHIAYVLLTYLVPHTREDALLGSRASMSDSVEYLTRGHLQSTL